LVPGREEREREADGADFGAVDRELDGLPTAEDEEVRNGPLRGGLTGTTSKSKSLT
jgi:hypothetical protein